jgi:hypothetical protein
MLAVTAFAQPASDRNGSVINSGAIEITAAAKPF